MKKGVDIREIAWRDYKYEVRWPSGQRGKARSRKRFTTKAEAEKFAREKRLQLLRHGEKVAASLKGDGASDYAWAMEKLAPFGVGIRDVVQQWVNQQTSAAGSPEVRDAIDLVVERKKKDGKSVRYTQDLNWRLRKFALQFGERAIGGIRATEIEQWLDSHNGADTSRANFRRALSVLFTWASRRYGFENPINAIETPTVKRKPPGILSPDDLRRILAAAPDDLVAPIALQAWAGCRTAEVQRMSWEHIDFVKGEVDLPASVTKTAVTRFVPMEPALRAYLEPIARPSGPIIGPTFSRRMSRFRGELAGGVDWPNNALRHSAASYWLAREDDAAKVSLWLGHQSPAMLFQHYRKRVSKGDADAWFAIRPSKGDMIEFNAEVA